MKYFIYINIIISVFALVYTINNIGSNLHKIKIAKELGYTKEKLIDDTIYYQHKEYILMHTTQDIEDNPTKDYSPTEVLINEKYRDIKLLGFISLYILIQSITSIVYLAKDKKKKKIQ